MSIVTLNNRALKDATAVGTTTGLGDLVFISRTTASSSSSLSITSGIDSTYKEYIFIFNNIHPATDSAALKFQVSTDSGSSYGVNTTSTLFKTRHAEDGTLGDLNRDGDDLNDSTSDIFLTLSIGSDNDQGNSGYLHLFEPSGTTFVKHYTARMSTIEHRDRILDVFCQGFFNTTSAIDAIIFRMSSGNIDSGTIDLYGVK
jgi:hypothetical protein